MLRAIPYRCHPLSTLIAKNYQNLTDYISKSWHLWMTHLNLYGNIRDTYNSLSCIFKIRSGFHRAMFFSCQKNYQFHSMKVATKPISYFSHRGNEQLIPIPLVMHSYPRHSPILLPPWSNAQGHTLPMSFLERPKCKKMSKFDRLYLRNHGTKKWSVWTYMVMWGLPTIAFLIFARFRAIFVGQHFSLDEKIVSFIQW